MQFSSHVVPAIRAISKATTSKLTGLYASYPKHIAEGLTLVPYYLANLLWLLSQKFLDLATKGYGGNSVVYACLRLLSQSIPEPPLRAYQRTDTGEVGKPLPYNHPLCKLLRTPNELMTGYEMWELVTLYLAIGGRSVWWKERDNAGRLIALWPIRPDRIGPIYTTGNVPGSHVITGWSYLVPGSVHYIPIPRQDTVLFNFPDPAGDSGGIVEGLAPLAVLSTEIAADNTATTFVGSLLANYATPGVVLATKGQLRSTEDAKVIKANFIRDFGGNRVGSPAVIDADTTVTQVGFSLQQLEFPNLRKVSESRIAAACGTPAILVGLQVGLDSGIRATIQEQRSYFAETTCENYWVRGEQAYERDVASEFGDAITTQFDRTKVKALEERSNREVDKISTGFTQGAVTLDEYREKVLKLPPLGGDEGKQRILPRGAEVTGPGTEQPVVNDMGGVEQIPDAQGNVRPAPAVGGAGQNAAGAAQTASSAAAHAPAEPPVTDAGAASSGGLAESTKPLAASKRSANGHQETEAPRELVGAGRS